MRVKQVKAFKQLLTGIALFVSSMLLSGCFGNHKADPELPYLVAYSILDDRFQTSTRFDITADIYNPSSDPMQAVQLTLTDMAGESYVLDYQTVEAYSQKGQFNAFPLKAPIRNMEVAGQRGEEFVSPSGLHFLFATQFKSVVLKYSNSTGLHEVDLPEIPLILSRSRAETIAWMQKEHEERQQMLAELEQVAKEKMAARKTN